MQTAVLFLIFNRPDTASQVFEAIRRARPPRLYVAADGPRKERPGEAELCRRTREIVNGVDWECEVHTLFRDENLGCGRAVSGAIGWFFSQEPEGIVLEDDCLPHPDFFPYCEELLARYRDDRRVAFISGNNFDFGTPDRRTSYYFSAYSHVWGWAAWRRSWELYDFSLAGRTLPEFRAVLRNLFLTPTERRHWENIFMKMKLGKIDTWDYQFSISLMSAGALCIIPAVPLIRNIGFTPDATHTTQEDLRLSQRLTGPILPLVHPDRVEQDKEADRRYMHDYLRRRISLLHHLKRKAFYALARARKRESRTQ